MSRNTKGATVQVGETLVYRQGRIVCWVTLQRAFSSCVFADNGNIEVYEVEPKCKAVVKRIKRDRLARR